MIADDGVKGFVFGFGGNDQISGNRTGPGTVDRNCVLLEILVRHCDLVQGVFEWHFVQSRFLSGPECIEVGRFGNGLLKREYLHSGAAVKGFWAFHRVVAFAESDRDIFPLGIPQPCFKPDETGFIRADNDFLCFSRHNGKFAAFTDTVIAGTHPEYGIIFLRRSLFSEINLEGEFHRLSGLIIRIVPVKCHGESDFVMIDFLSLDIQRNGTEKQQ